MAGVYTLSESKKIEGTWAALQVCESKWEVNNRFVVWVPKKGNCVLLRPSLVAISSSLDLDKCRHGYLRAALD